MKRKNIAIVSYRFNENDLRKQPWNYVYEISKGLVKCNYKISIISDGATSDAIVPKKVNGLNVFRLKKIRPSCEGVIKQLLKKEGIELLLWSIGPTSSYFASTFEKLGLRIIGFYFDSSYSLVEVIRAQTYLRRTNLSRFFRNALVPNYITKRFINSEIIKGIVTISQRSRDRLIKNGCEPEKIWLIRPGFDKNNVPVSAQLLGKQDGQKTDKDNSDKVLLYFGGPQEIRGLKFLVNSFAKALRTQQNLRLVILLRSDNLRDQNAIKAKCERLGIIANVEIAPGIQLKEVVESYLRQCHFVVLPFILVPSEMPISILEAMAFGKPVIGTNIDGIPELIMDRGIIVKPGDEEELKNAILRLVWDEGYYQQLRENCFSFMEKYPTWQDSVDNLVSRIEEVLNV